MAKPAKKEDINIKKSNQRWQSDVIVDLIKQYGFPYIALNPGASYRGLHDSLVNYGENDPPMLLCNHEKIAVQIAHGYAKASGKPMIAIVHDVVGLLHAPDGNLLCLYRSLPGLYHWRHRADGRKIPPPVYRLDSHRLRPRRRRAQFHQMGLPAGQHSRRAGFVCARLFDHDERAARTGLYGLRLGDAGSAVNRKRAGAAGFRRQGSFSHRARAAAIEQAADMLVAARQSAPAD